MRKKKTPTNPAASDMPGDELWTKLQKIGFSQVGFARDLKISDRTVRKWINGTFPVPTTIAILVNLMLKTKSTPEDLKA
jgi:DNA-binding transcriptional regulator YiaG